jgi:hypothetical protein
MGAERGLWIILDEFYFEINQGNYNGLRNTTVHTNTKGECRCVGTIRLVIGGTAVVKDKSKD